MAKGLNTSFEKETCGRCGGAGTYSYNQVDGSRCYGCDGKGERLTKRGSAAAAYLRELMTKKVKDVKVGDVVKMHGIGYSYYAPVTSITIGDKVTSWTIKPNGEKIANPPYTAIDTEHPRFGKHGLNAFAESNILVRPVAEEHRKLIEQAVAYQDTLTKAGKPRKQRAA